MRFTEAQVGLSLASVVCISRGHVKWETDGIATDLHSQKIEHFHDSVFAQNHTNRRSRQKKLVLHLVRSVWNVRREDFYLVIVEAITLRW